MTHFSEQWATFLLLIAVKTRDIWTTATSASSLETSTIDAGTMDMVDSTNSKLMSGDPDLGFGAEDMRDGSDQGFDIDPFDEMQFGSPSAIIETTGTDKQEIEQEDEQGEEERRMEHEEAEKMREEALHDDAMEDAVPGAATTVGRTVDNSTAAVSTAEQRSPLADLKVCTPLAYCCPLFASAI